jgi:protein SCO1/2
MFRTLIFVFLLGCGSQNGENYPLTGLILDVGEDSLVVDHEEVPGFMQAMVMRIRAQKSKLKGLKRGDRITANLRIQANSSQLVDIAIVGFEELPDLNGEPHGLVVGDDFPPTTLHVSENEVLQLGAQQVGVKILTFLFTTCPFPEACPLLASKLQQLQPLIRNQAQIVALTLDPETDNFSILKAYGESFNADPNVWRFAREPLEQLEGLFDQLEMMRYKRDGAIIHSLKLVVIDASGTIVHIEQDNAWNITEVGEVVRKAHAESQQK